MIAELTAYPSYRDSGIEWLGEVPRHWEVVPLKRVGWFSSGAGFPISAQGNVQGEIPFAKVSDMNHPGNEREIGTAANAVTREVADELGAHVFPRGTIIFPKVGGALLTNKRRILERDTCIDNNLMGCVVTGADTEFMFQVLRWIDLGRMAKPGPVPAIGEGEVREIRVQLPPHPEQNAIVHFLDQADRRIWRYIRAKERLIELLEEQKQAIIHQAVTGQIDVRTGQPYPAYKDSGVEWLGKVPEHWRVSRIRRLFRSITRKDIRGDEPKMSMSRRLGLVRSSELGNRSSVKSDSLTYSVCIKNNLVMNKYQAHNGLFGCAVERGLITPNYTVFRPSDKANTFYYVELFRSSSYRTTFEIVRHGVGDGMAPLYTNVFYRVPVIIPPFPEQGAIVEYLEKTNGDIATEMNRTRRAIALLREYRIRLIADIVTGKLDVREAAAAMPEELDAPTAAMETIDLENAIEMQEEVAL